LIIFELLILDADLYQYSHLEGIITLLIN